MKSNEFTKRNHVVPGLQPKKNERVLVSSDSLNNEIMTGVHYVDSIMTAKDLSALRLEKNAITTKRQVTSPEFVGLRGN